MTDLISRWKLGACLTELNDKLMEYKDVAELTDVEIEAFNQKFQDQIFTILIAEYKEDIRHKRMQLTDLLQYVAQDAPQKSVQKRLKQQIKVWIAEENQYIYDTLVERYLVLLTHGATMDELHDRVEDDTTRPVVQDRLWDLIEEWERELNAAERPANELARMAQDAQNIHTLAVSRQTNTMMDILAKVVIPAGQKTMTEILESWSGLSVDSVEADMRMWATKAYVIQPGDYLYRNTLRAVWAKIQSFPADTRKELTLRLWEECSESVGMCAQGHISRLLNVFIGFDTNAIVEESFQDKMAAISRMEIDSTAKIQEATHIMNALHMDDRQRQPWLEAF